jgi:hypothetical protein
MKKLVPFLVLVIALVPSLFSASLNLAWDGSCDTNVLGHWVKWGYVGSTSRTNARLAYIDDCGISRPLETNIYWGVYTNKVFLPGRTNSTYTINNLLYSSAYAVVVTRTNNAGLESDVSEEGIAVTPPQPTNGLPSAVQNFQILKVQ